MPETKQVTLTFFDWDDTLLATTSLEPYEDVDRDAIDPQIHSELKQLEWCVVTVLTEALSRGKVYIISNAGAHWVSSTAEKYLPGVSPLLKKITVISARAAYEAQFPNDISKWKLSAFQKCLGRVLSLQTMTKNIISIGDAHWERDAVRTVTQGASNTKTKTIKFMENPTIAQLCQQLRLVISNFHKIDTHDGGLDLMLKKGGIKTLSSVIVEV